MATSTRTYFHRVIILRIIVLKDGLWKALFASGKATLATAQVPLDAYIEIHKGVVTCADRHTCQSDAFEELACYHLVGHVAVDAEAVRQAA